MRAFYLEIRSTAGFDLWSSFHYKNVIFMVESSMIYQIKAENMSLNNMMADVCQISVY